MITAVFTPDLLRRLGTNSPHYTSYPTADRFHEGYMGAQYQQALAARAALARLDAAPPLAVYVRLPFCESVCYYCACNKVVTRHHERAAESLDALQREIVLHARALGVRQRVTQLHFGGGTPTFLSDAELSRLIAATGMAFDLAPDAGFALDVPSAFSAELQHLQGLAEQGLVTVSERAVEATAAGWYVVRAVAMVFDRYMNNSNGASRERFSRLV